MYNHKNQFNDYLKSKGFKDEINTNNIERYHNKFREFDKTRKGFGNMEITQEWNDGYRLSIIM